MDSFHTKVLLQTKSRSYTDFEISSASWLSRPNADHISSKMVITKTGELKLRASMRKSNNLENTTNKS